jgi:hypothetical protein
MSAVISTIVTCAFGSWFFAVVEMVAGALFARWAFNTGIVALRASDASAVPQGSAPTEGATEHGKFRRLEDGRILVRAKWPMFGFRIHTPFPLRGTVRFADGKATLEARAPLGPMAFFGLILLSSLGSIVNPRGTVADVFWIFAAFAIAVTLMIVFSFSVERPRMLRAYREMLSALRPTTA